MEPPHIMRGVELQWGRGLLAAETWLKSATHTTDIASMGPRLVSRGDRLPSQIHLSAVLARASASARPLDAKFDLIWVMGPFVSL